MENSTCIFCKIVKKEIPAKIVFEDNKVLAFEDVSPQAPVHILIIPKTHIEKLSDIKEESAAIIGRLTLTANMLANEKKVDRSGYRVVVNCGHDAGQAVSHLHMHLLGGRPMGWPPG
jgi:histidine triad (HIT) family protein